MQITTLPAASPEKPEQQLEFICMQAALSAPLSAARRAYRCWPGTRSARSPPPPGWSGCRRRAGCRPSSCSHRRSRLSTRSYPPAGHGKREKCGHRRAANPQAPMAKQRHVRDSSRTWGEWAKHYVGVVQLKTYREAKFYNKFYR